MLRGLYLFMVLMLVVHADLCAQEVGNEPCSQRYRVQIDVDKAGISGICILLSDEDEVLGAIVNEFGLSALSFSYDIKRDRVAIIDILPQIDRWYIRRVLRNDLRRIVPQIISSDDVCEYTNERYKLRYWFEPLALHSSNNY